MRDWFYQPENTFQMWDATHILTIFVCFYLVLLLFINRRSLRPYRKAIRITVGCALILSRISLDIWYITTGEWNLQTSLPLELCSIASLVCGVMLLVNSRFLCDIFYFIAIGGAFQAITTPALDFGFPQYRYLQFFLDHTLLIMAPLIIIWLYNYRLSWKAIFKSFLTINIIAVIVYGFNLLFSSNYMFLMHKPGTASLLDMLGPHPFYILALEGIVVVVVFFLLYLPFLFMQKPTQKL